MMKTKYYAVLEQVATSFISAHTLQLIHPFRLQSIYLLQPALIYTPTPNSLYYAPTGQPLQHLSPQTLLWINAYQTIDLALGTMDAPLVQPATWINQHTHYLIPTTKDNQTSNYPHINWINWQLTILDGIDLSLFVNAPTLTLPNQGYIAALVEHLMKEASQPGFAHRALLTHMASCLGIELMRHLADTSTIPLPYLITLLEEKRLLTILQHIATHLSGDLSNKTLAGLAGIVEEYLGQYFKTYMPESPQRYVERCRMQQALKLLQTTSDPIGNISQAVGLPDTAYFCRRFKHRLGIQPHKARQYPCPLCT